MSVGTILIVEDEPEVADVLEFNLRAAGFRTLIAADGLTACRLIGAEPPDLVLLDLLLPDLTGWEICRMVRSHTDPAVAGLPVVMLTALASVEDKLRGLELGADDYIPKPFAVREVVLKVENLVRKAREAAQKLRRIEEHRDSQQDLQSLLFHELRNKLVVIGGFANRLASGVAEGDRSRHYARVIHQASEYLGALAEQVLVLRQVEEGVLGLPAEGLDLGEIARGVAELHRPAAEEKDIRVILEDGAPSGCRGNALGLRVCLSNLVENAIRYSPAGATVAMRAGRQGGTPCLEVDDEGPGISEEEKDRVFERFYRGRSSHGTTGTGLGLYVVQTLCRAMGGEVDLSARPGGAGTRARLLLRPLDAPTERLQADRPGWGGFRTPRPVLADADA